MNVSQRILRDKGCVTEGGNSFWTVNLLTGGGTVGKKGTVAGRHCMAKAAACFRRGLIKGGWVEVNKGICWCVFVRCIIGNQTWGSTPAMSYMLSLSVLFFVWLVHLGGGGGETVFLCSPGSPRTCSVGHTGLELSDLPASASWELNVKAKSIRYVRRGRDCQVWKKRRLCCTPRGLSTS